MAFLSRADMYSHWGDLSSETPEPGRKRVSKSWKGVYPNPSDAEERYKFELALIRRQADGAQKRAMWVNYNFRMLSDSKEKVVAGTSLDPHQIMEIHYKENLAGGRQKFGVTRQQAQEDMRLAKIIGMEYPDDAVEAIGRSVSPLESAKLAYAEASQKLAFKDIATFLNESDDSDAKLRQGRELQKQIEEFSRALQKIVDTAAGVDPTAAGVKRNSGSENAPLMAITDKSAHTAAKNLLEYVSELDKLSEKLERNQLNKKDFKKNGKHLALNVKKYSTKGDGYQEEEVLRNLEGLPRNIAGSLSNLMGGMFELAIESALKEELGSIFSSVSALGAGGSAGSATNYRGETFKSATSKRDIAGINSILDVDIGFSAKNQYATKGKTETKLLDTNTDFVRNVIAMNDAHDRLLEMGFANPSMWATNSEMNRTIAALMADVAVAGLKGDRVDYIVYRDIVMPIEDYYVKKSGDFKFSGAKPKKMAGNTAKYSAASVISNGTTKLIFRTS